MIINFHQIFIIDILQVMEFGKQNNHPNYCAPLGILLQQYDIVLMNEGGGGTLINLVVLSELECILYLPIDIKFLARFELFPFFCFVV